MAKLERIALPDSLVAIDYGNFQSNPALAEVTVPAGVRFIGSSSFFGCDQLKSVIFLGVAPRIEHDCFH